jgi:hypothetical protein
LLLCSFDLILKHEQTSCFVGVRYIQLTPEGLFFSSPYIKLGILHVSNE